jgi:putative phosphoribosyl transferase
MKNDMRDLSEPALIWTGKVMLDARVVMPSHAVAAVILASVPSLPDETRDVEIATALHRLGVATLYAPLLTEDELQFDSRTTHFRSDPDFLGQRFVEVAQWLRRNRDMSGLPVGYAGSSSGAAGALVAAALRPDLVSAVVCIDGRTDLASEHLRNVKAPALLIVRDMPVLRMNREAVTKLRGERRIEILREPGNDAIVEKTVHWFAEKLALVPADAYGMV